jgi:aminodeoxyfutalosine deaminase
MNSLPYMQPFFGREKMLLVHNTFTSADDVGSVKDNNITWCFCPRANLYIENALPDFKRFAGKPVVIGTDSLASNDDLDILGDANLLLQSGSFTGEEVLAALTSNGAAALGLQEEFGTLRAGTKPGLNLLHVNDHEIHFIKKLA